MSFYVYKFLNDDSEIIYFGRTGDLKVRIERQHFVRSAKLPKECIDQVKIIFYGKFKYQGDAEIVEKYLICKYKPKYNKQEAKKDVSIDINEPIWVEYSTIKALIPIKEIEQYKSQIQQYEREISNLNYKVKKLNSENIHYEYSIIPKTKTLLSEQDAEIKKLNKLKETIQKWKEYYEKETQLSKKRYDEQKWECLKEANREWYTYNKEINNVLGRILKENGLNVFEIY